jgi:hypothetical protein
MWKALSARDWDSLKTFLSDDWSSDTVAPRRRRGIPKTRQATKIGPSRWLHENFDGPDFQTGTDVV